MHTVTQRNTHVSTQAHAHTHKIYTCTESCTTHTDTHHTHNTNTLALMETQRTPHSKFPLFSLHFWVTSGPHLGPPRITRPIPLRFPQCPLPPKRLLPVPAAFLLLITPLQSLSTWRSLQRLSRGCSCPLVLLWVHKSLLHHCLILCSECDWQSHR